MEAHYILIRGRTVLQYKHPSCLALCPPTSATRSPSSSALPSVVPTCSSVLAPPSSSGSSSSVDPSVNSSDWLSHVLSSTFVFSSSVLDEAVKKVSQFCFCSHITLGTVHKVAICPRGNLRYIQIYLKTNQKLLWKAIWGFDISTFKLFYLISCF